MEISAIKTQLSLSTILHYYGLKPDKNAKMCCPFHEDKTPSMQVYYKTQTAYCFSSNCKTHGKSMDVIDFIMHKENLSPATARLYRVAFLLKLVKSFIFIKHTMMSRNYKFHNPEGLYFISFAVVGWLDVFTRNEYKDLFLDSLRFCQKEKGLEIHDWCIISSHVHLVFRCIKGQKPELLIGDLKRYTSKSIVKAIEENPRESRKQFLLEFFRKEGAKSSNVTHYQFWRHDNKPIEL